MILVILGAGASYDSAPSLPPNEARGRLPHRPPLAGGLFLDTVPSLALNLNRFRQFHPILPYLQSPDGTIERALEILQEEAERDPERKRQLAAIRFYLHMAIWECEETWITKIVGPTNYVTLLDQLRRSRGTEDPVCLVTFNYDRMIESALGSVDVRIQTISQYITHPVFKLFKLHGSVHWAREVDTPIPNISERNDWNVANKLIQMAPELTISNVFRLVDGRPIGKVDDLPMFPAIAIPVETKRGYECPGEHLNCLKELLPSVTRILIVGWSGTEDHFLGLLKESLRGEIPARVVAAGKPYAEQTIERIQQAGVPIKATAAEGGFTDFIKRREAEEFLRS